MGAFFSTTFLFQGKKLIAYEKSSGSCLQNWPTLKEVMQLKVRVSE